MEDSHPLKGAENKLDQPCACGSGKKAGSCGSGKPAGECCFRN